MKITYALNKEIEKKAALFFIGSSKGGVNFAEAVFGDHPELRAFCQNVTNTDEVVADYVDDFYGQHKTELQECVSDAQVVWEEKQQNFIDVLTNVFGLDVDLSDTYSGYVSIFDGNGRNLEESWFQVYSKHQMGSVYVTMHEVLHFLFFKHVQVHYLDTYGKMPTNQGVLWNLSELFNDVILEQKEFVDIHQKEIYFHYPTLTPYLPKAKEIWQERRDIDVWLQQTSKILHKEN